MINDVMNFFGEDAGYIAEIEDHAVIWGLGISDQFATDLGLESVSVSMEMGTLAAWFGTRWPVWFRPNGVWWSS